MNDARHVLNKFLSDVIDMHMQVFSIIVSPLMIEFPGLRAIVCFRAPAGARLCHQGAPGTHHIIIRPVPLTTHPQPAHCVFPTGRSITSSLSQLKKRSAEFTQNSQICFISIVSNPQQIDVYFSLFFFLFNNSSMKNTAADPVESLLSVNQEAIFIMFVTIAPAACAVLLLLGG